jgi:ubiquinone/menaquinone biosynthesis C-methylase UbiE
MGDRPEVDAGRRAQDDGMSDTREEHAAPREAWDAIAAAYDTHVAPGEAELAAGALRLAELAPGERLLDVAAGTGGLSLPAARLGAKVVATDWAPAMIERLAARASAEGLRNVEARVMDCHALDFPDGTFDVTASQFGVMLVRDQETALREMARVTRPGGRVLVIAYGSPSEFEALQAFIGALQEVVPGFEGLPDDPPPLEFQVADPEVLRRRLAAAGLRDVRVDTSMREVLELRSGEELWSWCLGGNPIPGMLVAELSDDGKEAVRRALDRRIRERAGRDGVARLGAPLNVGLGRR